MLNYDEFKRELLKRVREKAGRDVTVEIVTIQKNNRAEKDAIAFSDKENNLQPLIYLDSIYKPVSRRSGIICLRRLYCGSLSFCHGN